MNLQVAVPEDSEALCRFFNQQNESGYFDYTIERKGHFFNRYRLYSDDFVTYILKDSDGSVHGVATLVFRPGILNGEKQMIGYATDLQVSTNRKAILNWSNHFLPILLHERDKRNCKYVFTVVTKAHRQAYNAFIRPRSPKRKLPRYHLFRKFQLVSLHGRLPFAQQPLDTISVAPASEKDYPELADYIFSRTQRLPLHYYESSEELLEHITQWPDFDANRFLVARDSKKSVIGCTLPWDHRKYQEISVDKYKGRSLSLYQGLKFFSFLRFTRQLPAQNQTLHFRFLTQFYYDNPDIFNSLLLTAWNLNRDEQFLTFCHFSDNFSARLPKSYIKSKITCGLYCLLAPEDPIPDFLKLGQIGSPPEFEPILL